MGRGATLITVRCRIGCGSGWARNVVDVWLSQYITDADSVTMSDLTLAFERARNESFPEGSVCVCDAFDRVGRSRVNGWRGTGIVA